MSTHIEFKKFSWTKWGNRRGLVKEELDEWSCQLCGEKHGGEMPSYFLPYDGYGDEYFRVCGPCLRVGFAQDKLTFSELLALKVANLLTLPAKY